MKKILILIGICLGCLFGFTACGNNAEVEHSHIYTKAAIVSLPTCSEKGKIKFTCDCGESYYVEIKTTAHTYTETVINPTCTENGYTVFLCTCGDEYTDNVIPAVGHVSSEAIEENRIEATCISDGSYDSVIYCSVCGEEISREVIIIEASSESATHDYERTVLIEPTCTSVGQAVYVCQLCRDDYAEEVPMLPHSYIIDDTTIEALDETSVQLTVRCDACGDEKVVEASFVETIEPTCIEEGYDVYLTSDEIEYHLNTVEATHCHIVGYIDEQALVIQAYSSDNSYIIDENIQHFIDEGVIRFNNGVRPTEHGEKRLAIFDCQHCGRMIVCLLQVPDAE